MRKLRCYVYQEGRDFTLPDLYQETSSNLTAAAEGVILNPDGSAAPHPDFFLAVEPEEAEVFLFPYDLGPLLNILNSEGTTACVKNLPWLAGREARHIFTDGGSFVRSIRLPVCLLKISLTADACDPDSALPFLHRMRGPDAPSCIPTWLRLPAHVEADKPSFAWQELRYDCSFVGAYSHVWRNAACRSMELHPGLRFYNGGFDNLIVDGPIFTPRKDLPETAAARKARFRKVTKESLTVLCPPGVGPQSFRLYETMYYGRIPVLISRRILYPLACLVPWEDFCLFIDVPDVLESGRLLRKFLDETGQEALRQKCVLARKTFLKYFTNQDRPRQMAGLMAEYLEKSGLRY